MDIPINVIDITDSIQERMKEIKMSKVQFAQEMKIYPANVDRTIKQMKKNLDTLLLTCRVLDYNFFKDFIANEKNETVSSEQNPNYIVDRALDLAAENARLQIEIDKLQQELKNIKTIVHPSPLMGLLLLKPQK